MNQIQQTISIFGDIGGNVTADQIRTQLATLDRTQPLLVEINSDGGSVQEGIAIFNMLVRWPGGITTLVQGWACSIASVILMAGDTRIAHENAMVMVHAPWMGTSGNAEALRGTADLLDKVAQTMRLAYQKTGQKESVISGWLDGADHWFSAAEAMPLGLVTELAGGGVQARAPINIQAAKFPIPTTLKARFTMTQTTTPSTGVNVAAIQAAAIAADTQRRNDIRNSFARFANRDGVQALQAACESDSGITAQIAADRLLAHLGTHNFPIAGAYVPNLMDDHHGDSRVRDFAAAAADVLAARGGLRVKNPHPAARDLQRMSVVGMAEGILSMTGRMPLDRSPSSVIRAALSTSDFPSLLSNTANKFLREGYETSNNGFAEFTAERDVADFKTNTLVNLSEAPGLGAWAAEGFLHPEIGHKLPETTSALVSASSNTHVDRAVVAILD